MHGRSRLLVPIAQVVIQEEHTSGWYEFVENFQTYDGTVSRKRKKCGWSVSRPFQGGAAEAVIFKRNEDSIITNPETAVRSTRVPTCNRQDPGIRQRKALQTSKFSEAGIE